MSQKNVYSIFWTIYLMIFAMSKFISTDSNADLVNNKVERTIELTSNLVHVNIIIVVENKAANSVYKNYIFVVDPVHSKNVAYIGAHLTGEKTNSADELEKRRLNVVVLPQDANKGALYRIDFKNDLAIGKSLTFEVELVLFNTMKPYPSEITQADKQLVLFKSNHYYYSLYQTRVQTTTCNLANEKTESFSQLKPTSKMDSVITYGPYENIKPFEQNEMSIHFENNSPFLTVTNLVRTIEISHWGNIAVEETIDMFHSGAVLKGPFSRFDYMRRQGGLSSVKSFKTLLPPSSSNVYYRDEIGNISTSNLRYPTRKHGEAVELELRPRFPLFGGWRTHYTIGYNLPIYQYLFNKGNDFILKMRLLDHIYEDQFLERATIKIILPEHCTNVDFVPPYSVDRKPNEVHYTYLDTSGRTVIIVEKKNSVENHIQDFELRYKFQRYLILKEPLLVVGFFYFIFTMIIIIVRIDFSLSGKQITIHSKKD